MVPGEIGRLDSEMSDQSWKNDRIFTGLSSGYPVELFLELIETEAQQWSHDESKMLKDAWCLLSSDNSSPVGLWKTAMNNRYPSLNWAELKSELIEAFGTKGSLGLDQQLELMLSLNKGESELFVTFLFRIQWVLKSVGTGYTNDNTLTMLHFLMGISESDQHFAVDKFKNSTWKKPEDVTSIVALLDDPSCVVPQVKTEPLDQDASHLDDPDYGVDYGGDYGIVPYNQTTKTKVKRIKKSRKRKIKILPEEDDDDDQVEDVKPGDLGEDSKPSLKPKKVSKTKRAKKEYTYPCSQCDEVLRSNKALLDHIINSHKVKCMACSQMFDFTDDQAWQEHEEEHWTKDFADGKECNLCPLKIEQFVDIQGLRIHLKNQHCNKQTRCELCKAPVRYRDPLHKCRPISDKLESQRSARGAESTRLRAGLRVHNLPSGEDPKKFKPMACTMMQYEDGVQKWFCGFCYQDFPRETDLKAHHMTLHQGYRYQCDICYEWKGKSLVATAQHKLQKHDVIIDTFAKYTCAVEGCGFMTVADYSLESHNKMVHSEEFAHLTQCNICGKRLDCASAMRKHVESVHMDLKRFSCDQCDGHVGFSSKSALSSHMEKVHGAERVASVCPLCGSSYRNDHGLQEHIQLKHPVEGAQYLPAHKRNRKFPCKECGQEFPTQALWKRHMKFTHSEDHWIKCPACDKKSKNAQQLRGHYLAKHLKVTIKPIECVTCNSSYVREKDCWIHIAMKHEGSSNQWNQTEWKSLSIAKPELIKKKDVRMEETNALRGYLEEKYLMGSEYTPRPRKWNQSELHNMD